MKILFNRPIIFAILVLGTFSTAGWSDSTAAKQFVSSNTQVQLVELYTSEGCSSCPPADRWLTSLSEHPRLWKDFVPLAFHVDYWNYIGWVDPFASKANSQRQRLYAQQYREPTVYTPGVRRAGKEWRQWRSVSDPSKTQAPEVGVLTLDVSDQQFVARYQARFSTENDSGLKLNIALLGSDLSSEVSSGENRGKTLEHDFVVLATTQVSQDKDGRWKGSLPESSIDAPRLAVAAWITNADGLTPIQATGGYLN